MPERVQKRRSKPAQATVEEQPSTPAAADLSDTDALLDEIDEALSGLDQDLATKFQQKGGQ